MGKVVARTASCFFFLLFLLAGKVAGRHLQYDPAELVSDGASDREEESLLHLKGMDSSEGNCHQIYGFLPCSTNLLGQFFLIMIYGYLLYCGESFVRGDERYLLFGEGYWGAVCFQLLNSIPEPLVLSASVALSNNEAAEEHLVVAVGLLVGSSILLLTVVWPGFCIFFCQQKFDGNENNHGLRLLTGSGVVTDSDTKLHARFMLVSLMPFIVIIIPMAFGVSCAFQKYVLALSLLVAVICLFCYFLYQNVDRRIGRRTQVHTEMERKVKMRVPFYDVQALTLNRNKHLMRLGKEMEKKMETNDRNMIGRDGSPVSFKEWYFQKRRSMDDPCSDKLRKKFNQVAQLLLEEKISLMKLIYPLMLQHGFLNEEDKTPDEAAIDRMFETIDKDGNSSISPSELKDFIMASKHEDDMVDEEVLEMIMTCFDIDGNGKIDREEFKNAITESFWEIKHHNSQDQDTDGDQKAEAKGRTYGKLKGIAFLGIGIFMLIFFTEPLTQSVQIFSESLNISPFNISFIFLPLATNAGTTFAAFRVAKRKRHYKIPSTFWEIYHKVFMNNLMGFALLLSVMYFRGFTWHFSAELLTLVIVCAVMGLLASFNSKFPNWTLFLAFFLYPSSLIFFNLVNISFL